jgi:dCMP deaminase
MSADRIRVWDERFMDLAKHIAAWSKESGRRVGAVIVGPDREVRSTGFNGFPRGVNDDILERHSRETGAKYLWSCHAEQNAIFNASRAGTSLVGCTMYLPWFPCVDCAKAIVQVGLARLVAYEPDMNDPRWGEHFRIATQMLREGGVKLDFIPGSPPEPIQQVV